MQRREASRRSGPAAAADESEAAARYRLLALRDENGQIPADGMARAQAQRAALAAASGQPPSVAGIIRSSWTSIGPGNIGGRVRAITFHPTTATTLLAGGIDGGIWRTTNSGASWARIDDYIENLAVTSLAFKPNQPPGPELVVYAGTGEGFYGDNAVRGQGLLRSFNGGNSWLQVPSTVFSPNFHYINRIAWSPDGVVLLLATRTGIFRSVNNADSFTDTLMLTGLSRNDIADLKFIPGSSTQVVASGLARNAYWSNDGGLTWTPATGLTAVNPGPGDNTNFRVELATSVFVPSIVYASVWGQPGQTQGQLWKSVDFGHSYALVSTPNHLGTQGFDANAIWVDPTNPDIVIVGGVDLHRSTNGGVDFTKISTGFLAPASAHADHHTIVAHPAYGPTSNRILYFGTDGGIYRADDAYAPSVDIGGGLSIPFTELNNSLGITQFYSGAGHAGTGVIIGGTQDNNTLKYTTAGGAEGWTSIGGGGHGGMTAIDQTDPNFMYAESSHGRVHRSTDGGTSTSYIYGLANSGACKPAPFRINDVCEGNANFVAPVVLDPNDPNRLLVGALYLWRTDDARTPNTAADASGPTWRSIKPNLDDSPISAIAVAPGDSDVIWVGHNNGNVYVTIDGTTAFPTWTRVDDAASGLPDRQVTSIAIHPTDHSVGYVALGGYTLDNIYRTSNSGGVWTDVTGVAPWTLPSVPVRSITMHPINPSWLYAGTEAGVFASANGGATWGVPNDGPANTATYQLFWMGTTLVAATHGRGMFTAPVPATAPTSVLTRSPAVLNFGATKNGPSGELQIKTPPQTVTVGYTGATPTWTAISNQWWAEVTGGGGATGAGQFTVAIVNPQNIIANATYLVATITISGPTSEAVTLSVRLSVQQTPGMSAPPFGQVDTPAQNATGQVGAIGVTGWVIDDLGVNRVNVYRDCLPIDNPVSCQLVLGHNLVFVGNGQFLPGARPDVEAAFPTMPQHNRAGWGLQILTNMLPHLPNGVLYGGQGTFALYAVALDIDAHETLLGRTSTDHTPTTITVANDTIAKPFGTIDTPVHGGTVSGVIANFGWVLTPDSNTVPDASDIVMPIDGSTMTVYIDGVATAQVAYNQCRGNVGNPPPGGSFCNDDISNIFGRTVPAPTLTFRNSNPTRYRNLDAARGAIGAYNINTALLANGLHTIAWGVSDSAGRGEGIGSRFFTVLNGGLSEPRAFRPGVLSEPRTFRSAGEGARSAGSALLDIAPAARGAADNLRGFGASRRRITGRTGFGPATPFREATRSRDGDAEVRLRSLDRLEIDLDGRVDAGYLVANDQLRDLPIGSTLDVARGRFSWLPPAGYFGEYELVFVAGGEKTTIRVTVHGDPAAPGKGRR